MLWQFVLLASAARPQALAILAQRCMPCHSEALKNSGLDLSSRELAIRGGNRGQAIVPGKAKDSLLYRVASHATEPDRSRSWSKRQPGVQSHRCVCRGRHEREKRELTAVPETDSRTVQVEIEDRRHERLAEMPE